MTQGEVRNYTVSARSTDTFGRVLCSTRNHHFVVDGPIQNGCPGEEVTPAELFLAGVAACGVELVHAIARDDQIPLRSVNVEVSGALDRSRPVRRDVTVFNSVRLRFDLAGVSQAQGAALIDKFKGR
ncbi:MAG TPA: OsmC family protein [Burkholderiales bacterium]|nr:OsmC family protein [Burkholderiales bacterium]